jgi:glucose/arabinose dehydrogenase
MKFKTNMMKKPIVCVFVILMMAGCTKPGKEAIMLLQPDKDNGGLTLPPGFGATVFADSLGRTRHIVADINGDVYANLRSLKNGKGLVAMRDEDQDGHADHIEYFTDVAGTGLDIYQNYLYYSSDSSIYRVGLHSGDLVPAGQAELIIAKLFFNRQHEAKTFTFDEEGNIYVNIGAPANACQEQQRTAGSPGIDPCPLLDFSGGIWRFDAEKQGQKQMEDGYRYSTGLRNSVAIDYNPNSKRVYVVQHGRDQLHQFFPEYYTREESAELPAEEFVMLSDGADFGWPYCYYDHLQDKKVLAPEYGGDGEEIGRCAEKEDPIMAFPGHWGPNALLFYTGDMFPEKYKNGAFVAFHGSWNRAPEQAGYHVVFVPFEGEFPSGDYEIFATDFAGTESIESPADAEYRATGLAQGPDGSLYVSDDNVGRIWKIFYTGE